MQKQSKRAFDGRIKAWRRMLHMWDETNPTTAPAKPSSEAGPVFNAARSAAEGPSRSVVVEETADVAVDYEDEDVL
jgi:hypothetical protein